MSYMKFVLLFCICVIMTCTDVQAQTRRAHSRLQANKGMIFHAKTRSYEAVGKATTRVGVRALWRRSSSPIHNAAAFKPMRCVRRNGIVYCTARWK